MAWRSKGVDLTGQVVVVAGASRGTGVVMCSTLAATGANVVMLARDRQRLNDAAATIGAAAVPIATDITAPDSVRAAFAEVDERFGRLDALVNNAAVGWPHLIEAATDAEIAAEINTNLLGPVLTSRAAIPLLRRTGGTIVNVSTESVDDPFPYLVLYAATKAGLEAFSRGLIQELKGDGIRVTLLRSGHTQGGEFSKYWDPEVKARAAEHWAAGGYVSRVSGHEPQPPERIAEALLYILSRPAGSMVDVISVRAHR